MMPPYSRAYSSSAPAQASQNTPTQSLERLLHGGHYDQRTPDFAQRNINASPDRSRDVRNYGDGTGRDNRYGNTNGGSYGQPSGSGAGGYEELPKFQAASASSGPTAKRGSKACVACRKGKNRCEEDPTATDQSCRRCMLNNIPCVFEKPTDRPGRARHGSLGGPENLSGEAEHRVTSLERDVHELAHGQNRIQNALQQILSMLPSAGSIPPPTSIPYSLPHADITGVTSANIFDSSTSPTSFFGGGSPRITPNPLAQLPFKSPQNTASGRSGQRTKEPEKKNWPKLPGFAPPNHSFGTYGIIPLPSAPPSPSHSRRSRSSSSHSAASSSALPQDSLTAPIQALQALANAADHATAVASGANDDISLAANGQSDDEGEQGSGDGVERGRGRKRKQVTIDTRNFELRVKKKKKPDPTPRNPFPDVVTKGLVSDAEARELWDIFFSGCHYFVPLWDKSYDLYETFIERTPFSTNGLLAVAAKIRAGNGPLGPTFHRCLEEAQGIARSTLFGPIVRKEAVMAILILSVWSQNGWLPCGHALRSALDINLHRALDKLADSPIPRSEVEERDLVVSARIWLNCYMHDHLVSLGTGKPLMLRDSSSVRRARILLNHPMGSETDMRLIAGVELVNLRVRVAEHLTPLHGKVDTTTVSFVRRTFADLQEWYREWYGIHRQRYDDESVLVKLLEAELVYAQMWTVCVALRGCQWDKLPADLRELAFQAKDAAMRCIDIFLTSPNFRSHLKYATHDQLVSVAFAAVFLLKIAMLYPSAIPLPTLVNNVSRLAHLLSTECFAERYALTLRLMLSNFRRKAGVLSTVPGTPLPSLFVGDTLPNQPTMGPHTVGDLDGGLQSLLGLPSMNFDGINVDWSLGGQELVGGSEWPIQFSPSDLPVWLQENNFSDLGLPADGSDSLFLPLELANMFLPGGTTASANQYALPDSGDVGAEAW